MQNAANFLANLSQTAQRKEKARGIEQNIVHSNSQINQQEKPLNPLIEARKQSFSPELKAILDYVFETLWGANPAWRSSFKSRKEMINYKTQLGRAMEAAGVNTMEKVEDGLNYAVQQPGSFMPSTGDFVTWCKERAQLNRAIREALERSKRVTDEKLLLCGDTWEERQQAAKSALSGIRAKLKGGTSE